MLSMTNKCRNGRFHTIKKGDTLYSLSRSYNVPLILILKANPGIDVYNLQIGEKVCIPFRCDVVCTELKENDGRLMAYVVKNDESLREVLDNNGDTLESFLENNRQEDILLKPGITVMIDKNGKNA